MSRLIHAKKLSRLKRLHPPFAGDIMVSKKITLLVRGWHLKLSTKGRYAVRAMLDLACHETGSPILIKDISEREGISNLYLKQLFVPLRVAGLIRTVRGANGGLILARPPSQIKLIDIINCVEGSVAPVECVDDEAICNRSDLCVTRDVWVEIKEAVDKILGSTTLQNLVDKQKSQEKQVSGK